MADEPYVPVISEFFLIKNTPKLFDEFIERLPGDESDELFLTQLEVLQRR